jgi:hypothetical protein
VDGVPPRAPAAPPKLIQLGEVTERGTLLVLVLEIVTLFDVTAMGAALVVYLQKSVSAPDTEIPGAWLVIFTHAVASAVVAV